jgi:galactitol-specific phosphotransferase system IIC component
MKNGTNGNRKLEYLIHYSDLFTTVTYDESEFESHLGKKVLLSAATTQALGPIQSPIKLILAILLPGIKVDGA